MSNPYAKFLGGQDPVAVMRDTPAKVAAFVHQLGPAGLDRHPEPGKWSPRQILCHLADCELAFAFRMRQALAEENHVIQPFDQDAWAPPYEQLDAVTALAAFEAMRAWNLALLASTPPESFDRPVRHPERGEMTFRTIVETIAGHDLNHIAQFDRFPA